jgi:hypothetical protein
LQKCSVSGAHVVHARQGRRLASVGGYRRLFAEGEGEGEGGTVRSYGCFPDFYYPQDFADWMQGKYVGALPKFPCAYSDCKFRIWVP